MLNLYRHISISIVNCAIAKSFGGKDKTKWPVRTFGWYIYFVFNEFRVHLPV